MRDYWEAVPRKAEPAPGAFSAPPTAREPDADSILARAGREGEWLVPVEMALHCSSSCFKVVVTSRRGKGVMPKRTARVIQRGDRYFATIFYGEDHADLFIPLDCWAWGDWP